jgi:hypothetical protein
MGGLRRITLQVAHASDKTSPQPDEDVAFSSSSRESKEPTARINLTGALMHHYLDQNFLDIRTETGSSLA